MTAVGYIVKTMSVKLKEGTAAAVEHNCAVTGVTESESHDTATLKTACPDGSITDSGPSTWQVTIGYAVSNLPGSLHRLLREHAGERATLTIEPFPIQEAGHLIEYDVTLSAAGADYTVGSFGTASVTLDVIGAPRNVDPVVTAPAPAGA